MQEGSSSSSCSTGHRGHTESTAVAQGTARMHPKGMTVTWRRGTVPGTREPHGALQGSGERERSASLRA